MYYSTLQHTEPLIIGTYISVFYRNLNNNSKQIKNEYTRYKIMNSKNKQTEIKAFLSFILEQSKETGLHVSCTIMSEEDTGEGYEIFAGHVSSCKGARLHRLLYGAIAVNENFRKAVTSALLEYERTKTVNRDKMSMN